MSVVVMKIGRVTINKEHPRPCRSPRNSYCCQDKRLLIAGACRHPGQHRQHKEATMKFRTIFLIVLLALVAIFAAV
ncbi:hypothetical protein ABTF80_21860, partial [Acinetobacter baumannii]